MMPMPIRLPGGFDGADPLRGDLCGLCGFNQKEKHGMNDIKDESVVPRLGYANVTASARRLGCSREHLSRVLHGKRRANERLVKALRRMGIEVEVA